MSKLKAFICTMLLFVVIFILLLATANVRGSFGISLFSVLISMMAGFWISDQIIKFYNWLRKDA